MSNLIRIKYKCAIALGYPFKMAIRVPGSPSPMVIFFFMLNSTEHEVSTAHKY